MKKVLKCHSVRLQFYDEMVGHISNNEESTYWEEVMQLESWCGANNLEINTQKTVEMTTDFRKKLTPLPPLEIHSSTVSRTESYKFMGTSSQQDLKWDRYSGYEEGPRVPVFPATAQKIWAALSTAGPVLHCHNRIHHHIQESPRQVIPVELRRPYWGCSAGEKQWEKKQRYKPNLLAIIMGKYGHWLTKWTNCLL